MTSRTSLAPLALLALAGCTSAPDAETTVEATAPVAAPMIDELPVEVVEEPSPESATAEMPAPDVRTLPAGPEPVDMEAMMAAYKAFGTPGPEHAALAAKAGDWKSESNVWMSPDQKEPMLFSSTVTRRMILGGRYMLEEVEGEMMGEVFEGMLLLGFNNLDKQYHAIWLDSMGTGFATSTGKENDDGVLEMGGVMKDPISPDGRAYRSTMRDVDDDTQQMEMFDTLPDGTEWKIMEVTYRRVK